MKNKAELIDALKTILKYKPTTVKLKDEFG